MHAFRRKPMAHTFLFDAYMVGLCNDKEYDNELAVITSLADKLEVLKGTQQDIYDIFCLIRNKDWSECGLFFEYSMLNREYYNHLLEYYDIKIEEHLTNSIKMQQKRLHEKFSINLEWMNLKYPREAEFPKKKQITKDFVSISIDNGIAVSFIQYLLDRKEIIVKGNKVYRVYDNSEELYVDLSHCAIDYSPVSRYFSVSCENENKRCGGVQKGFLVDFYKKIGLDPKYIATVQNRKLPRRNVSDYFISDEDRCFFPKSHTGKYSKDEIFRNKNGHFIKNIEGESSCVITKKHRYKGDLTSVLTSGKIRFTR